MQISESLKVNPANATERLSIVLQELKDSQRQLSALQAAALSSKIPEILSEGKDLTKTHLIAAAVADVPSVDVLRDLAVKIRDQVTNRSSTIALFAVIDSKPSCIVVVNDIAQSAGIKAGDLVKVASGILGGGGGGKADIAQGGGMVISEIPNAIKAIVESLS